MREKENEWNEYMDVNWDRASDDRDRWVDLRAEQFEVRPNKRQM